jgi:hypothetical protein
VLLLGLALLVVGAIVVWRHNREAPVDTKRAEAQKATYVHAIQEAAEQPPRFEVAFVQFRLSDLDRLTTSDATGLRYQIIPNELAQGLSPGESRRGQDWAVALLVTPSTPQPVAGLALRVHRVRSRGEEIIAPSDIALDGRDAGADVIEWRPREETGAIIALAFVHELHFGWRVTSKIALYPRKLVARRDGKPDLHIELGVASWALILRPEAALD